VFQPLRERLQRLADQLVYGQRATPYGILAGFSRRIGGALLQDEVLPRVAEAVAHGVGAARTRVRVYAPGGVGHAVAWPAAALEARFDESVLVLHRGEPVGEIAVSKLPGEPFTSSERTLLDDLATQVGPAFSNVRLTEDLRASRQRIVAAQDAERRRIERDLHDGAQQHLVAISVYLKVLEEVIEADVPAAREVLVVVQNQAAEALATLRDLARGIYPPALADRGIAAAIEAHMTKSRQESVLEVEPPLGEERFASAVEAAVYFCVLEALQNCSKHAPHATVQVRLRVASNDLICSIEDDGPGFDPGRTSIGTGLQGMADRLAAEGGSLLVEAVPGAGTTIVGRLPIQAGVLSGPASDRERLAVR
jgi:signal transduction histidine kinase